MKKAWFLPLLLAAALEARASGIPVVDAAALSQSLQNYLQLAQQYQMLVSQYEQQLRAYRSMNGTRALGRLLWNPALQSALPEDFRETLRAAARLGEAGLTASARRLYDESGAGQRCEAYAARERASCVREAAASAQALDLFGREAETMSRRAKTIESLMDAINGAEDAKSTADLTARIAAESAALQAEKLRVDALRAVAEETRLEAGREAREAARSRFAVRPDWKKHLE